MNNAGFSITGAIEDVTDDEARFAFETMVLAPMRLARLSVPHMRDRGWGRIVNVSSIRRQPVSFVAAARSAT